MDHQRIFNCFRTLFLILIILLVISCTQAPKKNSFSIDIIKLDPMKVPYTKPFEEFQSYIQAGNYFGETLSTITTSDVDVYYWDAQEIILSRNATIRLGDELKNYRQCGSLGQEPNNNLDVDCTVFRMVDNLFIISLEDKKLYGGLFVSVASQMRLDIPVIYPSNKDGKIDLQIRPSLDLSYDYKDVQPIYKSRIEIQSIYELFHELGKLR